MNKINGKLNTSAYIRKCIAILPAVFVVGLGIEFILLAGWGCDPITNFDVGVSMHLPISIGASDMCLGAVMFIIAFIFRRSWLNFGSFALCLGTGFSIDFFDRLIGSYGNRIVEAYGTPASAGCVIIGVLLLAIAFAYYLPINLGYAHWDIMAFFMAEFTKKSYGIGLTIVYALFFVLSLILGAHFGIGTVAATFLPGKLVDWIMPYTKPFTYWVAGMKEESATVS